MKNDSAHADPENLIGTVIDGSYEIGSVLGAGNTSRIYKAEHKFGNRQVAIKLLHKELLDHAIAVTRLLNEAKVTSSLSHPGLVTVYDLGTSKDARPFIVLNALEGKTLAQHLQDHGRLSSGSAISLFKKLCDALGYCHDKGVIHRGLNPTEIIVTQTAASAPDLTGVIIDFGSSRKIMLHPPTSMTLGPIQELIGSPLYMSCEQRLCQPADARSDVYALGCILYEALTGRPPFQSDNMDEVNKQHMNDAPPAMSEVVGDSTIPEAFETVVSKAMAKDPNKRYQTMAEMSNAFPRAVSKSPNLLGRFGKLFGGQ